MKKVVLITGALGGIGRGLVNKFMELNYIVIATDNFAKPNNFNSTLYIQMDLEKFSIDKIYADAFGIKIKKLLAGKNIDIIINNAAVQILGNIEELSRENLNKTFNINLLAPILLSQMFIKDLILSKGAIINISSIHSRLTKKNFLAYSTSKAALSAMTRAFCLEVGNQIRINAIEPAAIETEMLLEGFKDNLEALEDLAHYHPSGKLGQIDDVVRLVIFLAENKSFFLNGSVISLDGGISSCLKDPI